MCSSDLEGIAAHVIPEAGMAQHVAHVIGDGDRPFLGNSASEVVAQGRHRGLFPRLGAEDQEQTGQNQRYRQPLSSGGTETQETDMRIRLAEQFDHGPHPPIPSHENAGQQAGAAAQRLASGQPHQHREQQHPFAQGFVDLAGMTRVRPTTGKDHRPRYIGDAPEQFAVNEIGKPAEKQPDRRHAGAQIG